MYKQYVLQQQKHVTENFFYVFFVKFGIITYFCYNRILFILFTKQFLLWYQPNVVQQHKKQLVREKEMQQLKLQQEKDQQQDVNVVQVQKQNVEHQHEDERLQQKDDHQQKEDDDDNLVFNFFLFKLQNANFT